MSLNKYPVLIFAINFTGILCQTTKIIPFRGSEIATSWFNEVRTVSAKTRVECGHHIVSDLKLETGAVTAFRFDGDSTCILGNLGTFAGDLDLIEDNDKIDGVYVLNNCSAISARLGPDLKFFYSYFDDNAKRQAITQNNGTTKRVPFSWTDGAGSDYTNWPANQLWKFNTHPFKIPRSSSIAGFFKLAARFQIGFEIDPITISSYSIFAWVFHPITYHDGILSVGSTADPKQAAFSLFLGYHSQAGFLQTYLAKGLKKLRYFGSKKIPINNQWVYLGAVFNATEGTVKFYVNGAKLGNDVMVHTDYKNVTWNGLKYAILGANHYNSWYGWSPRATVELYDKSFSAFEAESQYQSALNYLEEHCEF